MSKVIKLTPELLKSQSTEMGQLQNEYDSLFAQITATLNNSNNNWSAYLANNFSGKIQAASNTFASVVSMLQAGSKAAMNSAITMESIDSQLAKEMQNSIDSQNNHTVSIEKKRVSANDFSLKSAYGNVVRSVKKTCSKIKKSYDNYGYWYRAAQWLELGKGMVKMTGGLVGIVFGASAPIGIVSAISGFNDIQNAANNIANSKYGLYSEIGKHNYLKDYLMNSYGDLGAVLGNEEMGRYIGKAAYYGLDVVTFLNSADKLLSSFGKLDVDVSDTSRYSSLWGRYSFEDLEVKSNFIARIKNPLKILVEPDSTGGRICDIAKYAVSLFKKGSKFVQETLPEYYKLN